MGESKLEQFLNAILSGPKSYDNEGTDAPGTNARQDVDSPGHPAQIPPVPDAPGQGKPDRLGYHQHGDPPNLARSEELMERSRKRYPTLATHGRPPPAPPEYNRYYDQFRSDDGYDKIILNTAHGSWVFGTTTSQPVTLDNPTNLRTSQYPGAVMVHPVLLLFSYSLSVAATSGQFSIAFIPTGGDFQFPLGEYNATQLQAYNSQRWIIPSVITDANLAPTGTGLTIGTLIITSTAVVGTPTMLWRMGIGWAYDIPEPAYKGMRPAIAGAWQHESEDERSNRRQSN